MARSKTIYIERLTALWALNESGLGGFLHMFNTPFTGLIVGGISILMVSLIAYYALQKWQAVLRALMIVLIVKMAVSPHSPVGAYAAVSFQGLVGAFLFSNFSWKGLTIPLLGLLTFLESALQKILVLTIIYGNGFWEAIDFYGKWIQSKLHVAVIDSTANTLIWIYVTTYVLFGILAGFFIKRIIELLSDLPETDFELPVAFRPSNGVLQKHQKPHKFFIVWLSTMTLLLIGFTIFSDLSVGWQQGLYILIRSLLVLSLWYLVLGPILLKLLKRYLHSKKSNYEEQVHQTLTVLPYLTPIITYSWKETAALKGYARFKLFIAQSISNCIHFKL